MNDCSLTPSELFFQLHHGETKLFFDDDFFVLDQHAVGFFIVLGH